MRSSAFLLLLGSLAGSVSPIGAQSASPVPIAIEARIAEELRIGVGDTVRLGPTADRPDARAVVAAVYDPVPDPARLLRGDRQIRLHVADLAALLGAPDRVDRFGVVLTNGVDPRVASETLNAQAFGYRVWPSSDVTGGASRTFVIVSRFHRAIGAIAILASAIFLLCIMLLKVDERRRDAAVMRFVGVGRRTIVGALVLESLVVALLGSILGLLIAWGASSVTNAYYRRVFDTSLTFSVITPGVALWSVALSLLLGVGAGLLAAQRLARTPPTVLWGRG